MASAANSLPLLGPGDCEDLLSQAVPSRPFSPPPKKDAPLHARLQSIRSRIPIPPSCEIDSELQSLRTENIRLQNRCALLQQTVDDVEHELEHWEFLDDVDSPCKEDSLPKASVHYEKFNRAVREALLNKNKNKTDELFAILKVLNTPSEDYLDHTGNPVDKETRQVLQKQVSETNCRLFTRVQDLIEELDLPDIDLDSMLESIAMERWELDWEMVELGEEPYFDYMGWWYSLAHHAGVAEGAIDNVTWVAGKVGKVSKAYKWGCALLAFTGGPVPGALAVGAALFT